MLISPDPEAGGTAAVEEGGQRRLWELRPSERHDAVRTGQGHSFRFLSLSDDAGIPEQLKMKIFCHWDLSVVG